MTTAAAIDRLVHHAVILEFDVKKSYRTPRDSGKATKPTPANRKEVAPPPAP